MDHADAEREVRETRDRYLEAVRSAGNNGASETVVDDHRIEALTKLDDLRAALEPAPDERLVTLVDAAREEIDGETW